MVIQAAMEHLFSRPGGVWRRLPRYVALVPLLRRRRVLVLGLEGGEGVAFLAAGQARSVVVADRNAEAVAAAASRLAAPGITCEALEGDVLPFSDGAFDAVVALRADGLADSGRLDEVRRVLADGGVLAVSLDNPSRLGLPVAGEDAAPPGDGSGHALLLTLRRAFPHVRLVGQTPVLGFLFADLAIPDAALPSPALDGTLLDGALDENDAWLAICADGAAVPEIGPTLVRLPYDRLAGHLLDEAAERDERLRELAGRSEQAEAFQARLDELEGALRQAQTELGGPGAEGGADEDDGDGGPDGGERLGLTAELEEALRQARQAGLRAGEDLEALRREHRRLIAEIDLRDERIATLEARLVRRRGAERDGRA